MAKRMVRTRDRARDNAREAKKGWNKDKERNDGEKRSQLQEGLDNIDFRDGMLLRKFVTQHGKIMPSRITGATAAQQREIARAIRRARVIGLMP